MSARTIRAAGNGAPRPPCRTCCCCSTRCPATSKRGSARFARSAKRASSRSRACQPATWTASSPSVLSMASRSHASTGSARARRTMRPNPTTSTGPAWASSCSATRTSTAATPTGPCSTRSATRPRRSRAPKTPPGGPTWAATAATWYCASCARTWPASGSSWTGRPAAIRPQDNSSPSPWSAGRCEATRWSMPATRAPRPLKAPAAKRRKRTRTHSPSTPIRTACAARSAPTSGAAIRAMPTCLPARSASSRGCCARSASTPTRSPTTWSPRPAFTACCDAAASTARSFLRSAHWPARRRPQTPACTSSAWARTSHASSNSCRARG